MRGVERFLLYVVLAMLVGRELVPSATAAGPTVFDVVVVRKSLIVQPEGGEPLAFLGATDEGGALYVMTTKGKDAAEVSARGDGGAVLLFDPQEPGMPRLIAQARADVEQQDPLGGKFRTMLKVQGSVAAWNNATGAGTLLLPGLASGRAGGTEWSIPAIK